MDNCRFMQWEDLVKEINQNEKDGKLQEKIVQLTDLMIRDVYENETYECINYIEEKIENADIWEDMEKKVRSQTDFYIRTLGLKKLPEDAAEAKIKTAYRLRYEEFENDEYICRQAKLNRQEIQAIRCLFDYCEFSVVLQKISKRRFEAFLVERGKFTESMTETIWELFRHCRQDIQILIYSRHFANLEMKLNYLMNGQDDLKKEIDFRRGRIFGIKSGQKKPFFPVLTTEKNGGSSEYVNPLPYQVRPAMLQNALRRAHILDRFGVLPEKDFPLHLHDNDKYRYRPLLHRRYPRLLE